MLVEDGSEARLLCLPNDVIELSKPLLLETILRVHVAKCLQIDSNKIEAGFPDLGEVPPFEASLAACGPVRIVTEDIDAASEGLVRLLQNWRSRIRSSRRG